MAVEFSLELADPSAAEGGYQGSLELWAVTVSVAAEPCVVIDRGGEVVAASPGCGELFSIDVERAVGLALVGELLDVRDFSAMQGVLPDWEVKKIPPLLAVTSEGLARGLLRVWVGLATKTVDAISVPLGDDGVIVGSLTFFAPVNQ